MVVVIGFIDTSSEERFKRLMGMDKSPDVRQKSSTNKNESNFIEKLSCLIFQ